MTKNKDAFVTLIDALKVLPNVGPKTAQRMAYHLLQHQREGVNNLILALENALEQIHHCKQCNTFCEGELCTICADTTREQHTLMVVHMPVDVMAIETANCYHGQYFVLMGYINPTQNMDLTFIATEKLLNRLDNSSIQEVILATNFTAEGDATAYVLSELLKNKPYTITRPARGMPLGGELEYIDAGTLTQSLHTRQKIK